MQTSQGERRIPPGKGPSENVAQEEPCEGEIIQRRVKKGEKKENLLRQLSSSHVEVTVGDKRNLDLIKPRRDVYNVLISKGEDGQIRTAVPSPSEFLEEVLKLSFLGQ